MRIPTVLVEGCVLLLLAGCGTLKESWNADYGVGPLTVDKDSASAKLMQAIKKTSIADQDHLVDADCFAVPVDTMNAATAARCKQQRNAAIVALMAASDDMCQAHLKTIFGNEASFNIITGSVTNLAAGWATITNGLAAKSAMSAVALFSNAERSLVNETVYKSMLVTAVTTKIREARDTRLASIIPTKFEKNIDDYPMLMAVPDVLGYHYMCSFMFGLEKALSEGTQPNQRKTRLEQEKRDLESYVDNRSNVLRLPATVEKDEGIQGAKARIKAIEEELLAMIKAQK